MKIAHLFWNGPVVGGGIETVLPEELNYASREHSYYMVFLDYCDDEYARRIADDVEVHACGRKSGTGAIGAILPVVKLNWHLARIKPDLIVFHDLSMFKYVFYKGAKRLGRIHNPRVDGVEYANSFDHLSAISKYIRDDVCQRTHWREKDISVVYQGVHTERFEQKGKLELLDGQPLRIIQVSRLDISIKAQDLVLRSLKRCMEKYGFENWTYNMMGAGVSEQFLRDLARELGIEEKVHFFGQVSREFLFENLKDYDLFILPSHYEGLGNVISEAMAAKVPVLCSNIDGPAELVGGHGERGYLFEAGNENLCATAIMDVYNHYGNNDMLKTIERAYAFSHENLDVQGMVSKLTETYERVVAGC